ncbi:MAG: DNA repair protein RadC [Gammaproteobacteria bacterium]|nr:DNA repair protein RadC [Gammaproteobacteria bacterium]
MTIKDWPLAERPREKLLTKGAAALSDAELLAIFLRTGIKGQSAVALARTLIQHFGDLRSLLSADAAQVLALPGIGEAKYAQLQAALEIVKRHLLANLQRSDALTSPDAAEIYIRARLRDYPYEVFACLFLDNKHRVLGFEELFRGTLDSASVYPREIARRALALNAAALILAHNHPSGIAEPSDADKRLTERIKSALALLDIRVLDHLVVGDTDSCSFASRGWL